VNQFTEKQRLDIVNQYYLFDSEPELEYDNITFLASKICNTPISTITLVDENRQWFKSKIGFEHNENPKNMSFCALSLSKNNEVLVVPNLMEDEAFSEIGKLNGLEKDGFYASVTLYNENKIPLGTLCVIDFESKTLDEDQVKALQILGKQVEELFKLRLKNIKLQENFEALSQKHKELKKFSSTISHDIQTPINNIISLISLINEEDVKEETIISEYLNLVVTSSEQLKEYVNKLLTYYTSDNLIVSKTRFPLADLISEINQIVNANNEAEIVTDFDENLVIITDKTALSQILINIISNGIKYNTTDKPIIKITNNIVNFKSNISISDNGIGIDTQNFETIFQNNKTLSKKDRYGNYGTGLGLSIVKNLTQKINFDIKVTSEMGKGSIFTLMEK
jgi:signal transduction histidine kinase